MSRTYGDYTLEGVARTFGLPAEVEEALYALEDEADSLRSFISQHAEHTIRRAVEENQENAQYPFDEDAPIPFAPAFSDYDLWEAAGVDWKAIRRSFETERAA